MMHKSSFKIFSIVSSSLWLLLFACIPFLLIFISSWLVPDPDQIFKWQFTLDNYHTILSWLYLKVFFRSLIIALLTTLLCLLLAYPFAYILMLSKSKYKHLLLMLVIIPLWTSSLIRTFAMIAILKAKGVINVILLGLGLIHQPIQLLFTNTAVIIGMVYNLLPFMIIPLYANLERFDLKLAEAAYDLGATQWYFLRKVLWPISIPGVIAGSIMVFLPAMTIFYIPTILGGAKSLLLGNLIQMQFLTAVNWPLGAACSMLLIILVSSAIIYYWRHSKQTDRQDLL